MFSALQTKAIW